MPALGGRRLAEPDSAATLRAPVIDLDDDDDDDDGFVELRVALPNHAEASVELLWAEALGDDEYVLRATPVFAYGLNRGDRVRASAPTKAGMAPSIDAVVAAGGHRTLRVTFLRSTLPRLRLPMMDALREFGVSYEGSLMRPLAVDVPVNADYRGAVAQLKQWSTQGRLHFTTCEARVVGSFDEAPDQDTPAAIAALRERRRRSRRMRF